MTAAQALAAGTARAGILVCVALAPWLVGGAPAWAQHWLAIGGLVVSVLVMISLMIGLPNRPRMAIPSLLLVVGLLLSLGAFQLLELGWHVDPEATPTSPQWLLRNHGTISVYTAETRMMVARWSLGLCMCFAGATHFATRSAQAWLWGVTAANGVALAFFGLAQKLSSNGKLFWTIDTPAGGEPFFSAFLNRNQAAGYLNLCMVGVLGLLIREGSQRDGSDHSEFKTYRPSLFQSLVGTIGQLSNLQITAFVAFVLVLAGVFGSVSRGGIAACALGILACLIPWIRQQRSARPILVVAILGVLALAVVAWLGFDQQMLARFRGTSAASVLSDARVRILQDSIPAILDRPFFGSGAGTFHYMFQPYQSFEHEYWFYNADNQFLEFTFELGFVGLAIIVVGLAMFSVGISKLLTPSAIKVTAGTGYLGLFLIASQSSQAFFDFGVVRAANLMTIGVLAGAIAGSAATAVRPGERSSWMISLPSIPTPVLGATIAVVVTVNSTIALDELHKFRVGRDAVGLVPRNAVSFEVHNAFPRDQAESALKALQMAAQVRPDDADVHKSLGIVLSHLYSLSAFEQIMSETAGKKYGERAIWQLCSTRVLHQRLNSFARQSRSARYESVTAAAPVQQFLPDASRHLRTAVSLCPVVSGCYPGVAELAFTVTPDDPRGLEAIQSEVLRSHGSAGRQFVAGLLAFQAADVDLAAQAWSRSLELDEGRTREILDIAEAFLPMDRIIDEVLPASPEVLLSLADSPRYAQRTAIRKALAEKAAASLGTDPGRQPSPEQLLQEARTLHVAGDFENAAARLELAIQLSPQSAELHFHLARILQDQGKYQEALRSIGICTALAPGQRKYLEYRDQLAKAAAIKAKPTNR